MTELRDYASNLSEQAKSYFEKTYGKLLELLEVKVQVGAITALAQYYDPDLRCFTFSNFQLAPALEEFAQILGQPLLEKPYHYRGNYPATEKVVKTMGIKSEWLTYQRTEKMPPKDIPRVWLKEVMGKLIHEKKGEAFANVLALSIYDLILIPSRGSVVSPAAIDVYMARKCRGESSAFPILADLHYTLNQCHKQGGTRIECCIPVLYVWVAAHVIKRKVGSFCPVLKLTDLQSRTYSDKEWRHMFIELKEETVCWSPLAIKVKRVLYSCGEFPNVPLMGTLGCINYNPVLALRQLRYPMTGPPTEESLSSFETNFQDGVMLSKIRKAWRKITYKTTEDLGNRSIGASTTYKEWVRRRVEKIKLPFVTPTSNPPREKDTIVEDSDEVKILNDKLVRSEAEKEALEAELKNAHLILKGLEMVHDEKIQSLEQAKKRARTEKDTGKRTKNLLSSTNQDLRRQIVECQRENEQLKRGLEERERLVRTLKAQMNEQASQYETNRKIDERASLQIIREYRERFENKQLKVEELLKDREEVLEELWDLKGERMDLKTTLAGAQQQLVNLDREMQETINQYEEKISNMRSETKGIICKYLDILERKDEELGNLGHWAEERSRYMGLVREARNNFIDTWYTARHWVSKLREVRRIPRLVRDAEAMINPLTTPPEAIELIEVCKRLVENFDELVEQAKEDVVIEIVEV